MVIENLTLEIPAHRHCEHNEAIQFLGIGRFSGLPRLLRSLAMTGVLKCERGVAFIEFAILVSLLLVLYLGGIEVSRYILLMQKITDAANQQSDIITTINPKSPPSQAEMNAIMQSVGMMVLPYQFTFNSDDMLIISDIYANPPVTPNGKPQPTVMWRYCSAGASSGYSHLGAVGQTANLSGFNNFAMATGNEIVVAEIFFNFVPILSNNNGYLDRMIHSVGNKYPLYAISMTVPRFGSLAGIVSPAATASIQSNCP